MDEIRAEIEQTREEYPFGSAADDLMDGVLSNPIPVAMVSIGVAGLAWLAFGGKSRADDSSAAQSLGYETASTYAPGDETFTARKAQNQMQRMLRENPLMIGAAAIVVGAAVGMALPETERENELVGEARDSVVRGVQEKVRDT
jgi:hypothetical protein